MEPRHEKKKDQEPRTEATETKPRRFRIVKLEERIAPSGGNVTHDHNKTTCNHACTNYHCC